MLGEVGVPFVLREAAHAVRHVTGARRATIYLVRGETRELESEVVLGNVSRTIRIPMAEESLAGYCAVTGKPLAVPDAYGDLSAIDPRLRFDRRWDELNGFRTRDVLCSPVLFRGEVLGVIQAINGRSAPLGLRDLPAVEGASRFVAYALYHARLYDELASMKRLEKEKAEFMRIVVHELRAPVTGAKSLLAGLRFAGVADPAAARALEKVEARMDNLLGLVQDILELSRVKSGRPLGEIATCDLARETVAACESHRDAAGAKGLRFDLALPQDAVPVRVDRKGYHLVVSNLVSNAVKYTASGSVQVSLACESGEARLVVRDSGMGIPAADLPKMFGEFFRASNARRSGIGGTGVGLAGTKELVERFGGRMGLESEEGRGSTFSVWFPLAEDSGGPPESNTV
jgi:signal transduction histidine kinase